MSTRIRRVGRPTRSSTCEISGIYLRCTFRLNSVRGENGDRGRDHPCRVLNACKDRGFTGTLYLDPWLIRFSK